jgi:photosystem II stability/assembly factor-like uncharacterized protein
MFFPEPAVVNLSAEGDPTVWVEYSESASQGDDERVIRSDDQGATWQLEPRFREAKFLNSANSAIVYRSSDTGLLDRSQDKGVHWESSRFIVTGLPASRFAAITAKTSSATLHFGFAGINPQNSSEIYGTMSVWIPSASDPHTQRKTIDMPGIYVSRDTGDSWTMFAPNLRGYSPSEPPRLGIDAANPRSMIGHGISGLVMTTDGGKSWNAVVQQAEMESPVLIQGRREGLAKLGRDARQSPLYPVFTYLLVRQIEFVPNDGIYVVANKGLFKSSDGARSWRLIFDDDRRLGALSSLTPYSRHPGNIYLNSRTAVWFSGDGGCHFRKFFDWSTQRPVTTKPM